jgi:glycosyltransferase involved in cell wall biosynthesis
MLRNALALANVISSNEWNGLGRVDIVIGLRRDGPYDWMALDAAARACGGNVFIRPMEWTAWRSDSVRRMFPVLSSVPSAVSELSLPRDHRHNFLDCDAWIVFGQSIEGYVAPVRPYAIYCADVIQRYVPQIFDSASGIEQPWIWSMQERTFLGWRAARCVFATTPQTVNDVVSYVGVPSSRVLLTPTMIDPLINTVTPAENASDPPSIVWVTNPSPHKNHVVGVAAARIYYEEMGGTLPLILVGVGTESLDPQSGAETVAARAFREAPEVMRHTRIAGEVSDAAYRRLVSGAAVVWHNVIADNGTFVAFDAARAGRHVVSSDYPQMRYLCERYGVAPIWHRPDDARAAAHALLLAENRFRAGESPHHSPRSDTTENRIDAYAAVLQQLLGGTDA